MNSHDFCFYGNEIKILEISNSKWHLCETVVMNEKQSPLINQKNLYTLPLFH